MRLLNINNFVKFAENFFFIPISLDDLIKLKREENKKTKNGAPPGVSYISLLFLVNPTSLIKLLLLFVECQD
jgi:hypothetical protein